MCTVYLLYLMFIKHYNIYNWLQYKLCIKINTDSILNKLNITVRNDCL